MCRKQATIIIKSNEIHPGVRMAILSDLKIVSFLYLLLLFSCGGGGGGIDSPIDPVPDSKSNPPNSPPNSTDIPIPFTDTPLPVLTGNIFSYIPGDIVEDQDLRKIYYYYDLYLMDETKDFQDENSIFARIELERDFFYSTHPIMELKISLNGEYDAITYYGETEVNIAGIDGGHITDLSGVSEYVWLPDSSGIIWLNAETLQISIFDISSGAESILYENTKPGLTAMNSLAVSPDGEVVVWAEHYNDNIIKIYHADLQASDLAATQNMIWKGAEIGIGNGAVETQFISNKQFVFNLSQLKENGGGSSEVVLFCSNIENGNTDEVFRHHSFSNSAVSNSGMYIAFMSGSHSLYLIETVDWTHKEIDGGLYFPIIESIVWSPHDDYLLLDLDNNSVFLYPFPDLDKKWEVTAFKGGFSDFQWIE
jgi:hypothetical protein